MKFNKTVATALANKVHGSLKQIRRTQVESFQPDADQVKKITETLLKIEELKNSLSEARDSLNELSMNARVVEYMSTEQKVKQCIAHIAENTVPKIPALETLIDDFLIESLDADNSDELIAKVTAKYSA